VQNFISVGFPIAESARGEKSHTQSPTHSTSLFDALGTEAFTSEYM